MPAYIVEPTTSQGPVSGQQNQAITTIPCIVPGISCYSFGRLAGYNDAPAQNSEFSEAVPANGTAGRQFATRSFAGLNQNSPAIGWEVTFDASTTYDVVLQGAFRDVDAEYYTLDEIKNTDTPQVFKKTVNLGSERVNFVRIKVVTTTGVATIIAKIVM